MRLKYQISLFLIGLFFSASFAQQSVQEWQESHPNVLFIESSDYNALSENDQSFLKDFIVYNTEISIEDIQLYESENLKSTVELTPEKISEGNEIKNWLGVHNGVKVIPNSYYAPLSDKDKTRFQNSNFLVLEGEVITLRDIENYENIY